MTAKLLLHWQLDDLSADHHALDSSGNGFDATAQGDPRPHPDGRFGSCLILDGDALTSQNATALGSRTYTVQAWVRAKQPVAVGSIVGKVGGYRVAVDPQGKIIHGLPKPGDMTAGYASPAGSLEWDAWHHVAVTSDGTTARTYLDGVQIAQGPVPAELLTGAGVVAGRSPDASANHLTGALAHVRMYDGALSALEIQRDMAADESAMAAFVRTHPLDFDLFNTSRQRVLYIDDAPAGQTMTLRLTNSSRYDLRLRAPAAGAVSPTNYHVALRFRAGILDVSAVPRLSAKEGWSMRAAADVTTLYLLCTATPVISPGASLDLELAGLKADGAGGTRGTRVELDYQQLGYAGEPGELTGNRLQFLDVVNHRGRPDIPLDVAFVGGDRVLSDGVSLSSLRLRITNVSRETAIKLSGSTHAPNAASAFVVSFDAQQDGVPRDWALTRASQASSVRLTRLKDGVATTDDAWTIEKEDLGQRVQWTLTPKADIDLTESKPLELKLSDISALASPGHAPVVIAYRNIPGFQDGFVSILAERTPLLFTSANVGIGTATPEGRLHIVGANTNGNGSTVVIGPVNASNLRLGYDQNYSWVQSHGGKPLAINPVGANVGIGTTVPEGRLHIVGANTDGTGATVVIGPVSASNLRLGYDQNYSWVQSHGGKPLAINPVNNNVGIGTTSPGAKLTVSSEQGHLQLRRDTPTGSGTKLFLELYQADTTTPEVVFPTVRFAHANKFSHRIEARAEGIYFKDGDLAADALRNVYAQKIILDGAAVGQSALTIGDVTVGAVELRILKALADGKLQFDLQNTVYAENAYVDTNRADATRRMMVTRTSAPTDYPTIPRNNVGHWRIRSPFRASD
ncbi:LamG domain-containing protein [Nonomuraea guangzhouensis]|uniref:LamG domain-containing protein n=1 Tax=Nonomuraea guangzhouensis TaxID=1291555 RepID=A0ABW4GVC7_9ACTN|nr:LamG domain-containing protein [Nonomuraea guangzhouensis]